MIKAKHWEALQQYLVTSDFRLVPFWFIHIISTASDCIIMKPLWRLWEACWNNARLLSVVGDDVVSHG